MKRISITASIIFLATAALLLALLLLPGCSSVERWTERTGVPVSTNAYPKVEVHSVTNTVFITNVVPASVNSQTGQVTPELVNVVRESMISWNPITNMVYVTNYAPKPEVIDSIRTVGEVAGGFGFPLGPVATGTITTILGALYGLVNKRKAQAAQGKVNELETVSVVLVQNVEAMKALALQYAKALGKDSPEFADKVNRWANDALSGAQGMAGVETIIRELVSKHTGNTRSELGIVPLPPTV
jgi:hypothetical protein